MKSLPTPPRPGEPIRSSLISAIISAIRERTPRDGTRTKVNSTPNGFSIETDRTKESKTSEIDPWTFYPDSTGSTGGWRNCRIQIGYDKFLVSPDITSDSYLGLGIIEGSDETDDGEYCVEVNAREKTAEIKILNGPKGIDNSDKNIIRIPIGRVENGHQTERIPMNPVVYIYQ